MPVTLSEAARRLGLADSGEVKGIAKVLRIHLRRPGDANMLLMDERDLERIRRALELSCNSN
jgi:hypothetical protein